MPREGDGLRKYRRGLVAFVLAAGLAMGGRGVWKLTQGKIFEALVSLLAVGFFVLLAYGYRQDEEERNPPGPGPS